ncbi:uncharacterized protein LOC117291949 [Asterias rubens]|uniref:uncharacterized protein LOC117291949 n=1 Tax=Asterias rubens TaxID=7604 RepID=UPI001455AA2C|nr:uncharacterized protein LOC117291949 [Asterias rubens]
MQMDAAGILQAGLAIILLRLMSCAETMECFSCPATSRNDDECRQNGYVDQCTVGYHTCFTQIKYEGGSHYRPKTVTRSCVDDTFCSEEQKTYNNGKCDVSNEDYICVWCCHENNCNMLSSAHRQNASPLLLFGGVVMVTYLSSGILWHWMRCGYGRCNWR